jgi:outer membrane protein
MAGGCRPKVRQFISHRKLERHVIFRSLLIPIAAIALPYSPCAYAKDEAPPSQSVTLSPTELFALADRARDAGDFNGAEVAYRALAGNPDIELRPEARFRLGLMLADRLGNPREAAVFFREILDEKPNAARVRFELARMHVMLGNSNAAEREFRAVGATAALPPEVERLVRFYANALSAFKPFGGSIELALAPDTNVNRATRSDTLGTVVGDLTLDEDARARSGVGVELRGQVYSRVKVGASANLLLRVSAGGSFYRAHEFHDYALSVLAGPEFVLGQDRITLSLGPAWRWYGTDPFSMTLGGSVTWQHPIGKRAQLRLDGGYGRITNRRNRFQDADQYTLSAQLDRAFSARAGGGAQLFANREAAREPGFSTTSGGVNLHAYREMGRTTAVVAVGFSHLRADQRLFLFPRPRIENRVTTSLAGTFRSLRVGSFAPFVRLRWELNRSTIELYDYSRASGEFGITSAF